VGVSEGFAAALLDTCARFLVVRVDGDDLVGVSEDVATALLDTRVSFLALGFDGDNLVGVDDDVAADLLVPRLHCTEVSVAITETSGAA